MYLQRKIDEWLIDWKQKKDHLPALVVGVRQCGKTESIKKFGSANYDNMIYMNFWTDVTCAKDFEGTLNFDEVISNISIRFPNEKIMPKKTLIFLDEIQECPRARLFFKNAYQDGRYDVIGSGSYIGLNGYIVGDATPVPTGYEDVYKMKTMDFEEFLWANNYNQDHIKVIEEAFLNKTPVPDPAHELFKKLFNQYMCIGGFPRAVSAFLENHNIMDGIRVLDGIRFDMMSDFGRRVKKDGTPVFKPAEVARIRKVFELIPTFLAKDSKRFIVSKINSGSTIEKNNAIEYLVQTGVICKAYNLTSPSLPLLGNKIDSQFKIFPTDIGISTSMYGIETISAINSGNLGYAKGALYEALVADSLYKAEVDVFYFAKESGLEIDFVICYDGDSYLVEAKAKNGNAKSAKTVMNNEEHYGKTKLLKIGDYNVGMINDIITIPHYMTFLIGRKTQVLFDDLSSK